MANYWVVGANWEGVDKAQDFVNNGIWMLGWEEGFQRDKADTMKKGDRIAIKSMKGQGQTDIRIKHVGIIQGVVVETNKVVCAVDWVATDLDRSVDNNGCLQSVHGPFGHDAWVEKVFCL